MEAAILEEGLPLKHLAIFSIAVVLLLSQGCTSNDRVGAGTAASITTPASASVAPPSGGAAPISRPSDPAANGGSSLPAAAPYSEAGSASAAQNVNPAPFLTASQGGASGPASAPATKLTSRADGTMIGPNDQPAATTGWGTTVPQATAPATSGKSAVKPKGSTKQ